jgi:hypothetical protein
LVEELVVHGKVAVETTVLQEVVGLAGGNQILVFPLV